MPAYLPVRLRLVKGYYSAVSLGYTGVTDLAATSIDFLSGIFSIRDDGGQSAYRPKVPTIKGGGVWIDSTTMSGRELVAAKLGNVIDTVILRSLPNSSEMPVTSLARSQAESDLAYFAERASAFFSEGGAAPVYLEWWAAGLPTSQFALVYTVGISKDGDGLDPSKPSTLTLAIEREGTWRPIPPGASPKMYTLLKRNLEQSSEPSTPAAGKFNWTNLAFDSFGGAASYQNAVEGTIINYDEAGTSGVNYVDIPADAIPGDAPAGCMICVDGTQKMGLYIGRSTIRDLYPAINTANPPAVSRMRNTMNGGDASIASPTGWTTTKFNNNTYGLLSNGSIVTTRYSMRSISVTGAAAAGVIASWLKDVGMYARKWAVFCRCRFLAGSPDNTTMYLRGSLLSGGFTFAQTPPRTGTGMTLNTWYTRYLGILDMTPLAVRSIGGIGLGTGSGYSINIEMLMSKLNDGVASSFEMIDIVLMPYDEPYLQLKNGGNAYGSTVKLFADSAGYFSLKNGLHVYGGAYVPEPIGREITLIPNVINRLYFMADTPDSGGTYPTGTFNISINVLPRWIGSKEV